jgi:glutathione S-transferase
MNIIETGKLLAVIGAVDRRQEAGKSEILAWQELLADAAYADAEAAVREHRRTSTDWIQPAHILAGATKIRSRRLEIAEKTGEAFPNDIEGVSYFDELRALRKAIGDGRMSLADLAAYHASGRSIHLHETRGIAVGARVVRGELA